MTTTTTNTAVFTTRKPNIIERIAGYLQRRKFNKQFAGGRAARAKLHEQMIAERQSVVLTPNN